MEVNNFGTSNFQRSFLLRFFVFLAIVLSTLGVVFAAVLIDDSFCFDSNNVGQIGEAGTVCEGMLIVDRALLDSANETIDGSDRYIFRDGTNFTFGNSNNNIFTGQVDDMRDLFRNSDFNADIGYWNVSNVRIMDRMFKNAAQFNVDIGSWDVSSVESFGTGAWANGMFYEATSFNNNGSNSINNWDTSSLVSMSGMFYDAFAFNQPVGNWDVSNVINMQRAFRNAREFNQDLSTWDVSNVQDMNHLFRGASNFDQDISGWNVSNVQDMGMMFSFASTFNQDISSWDVSNVTRMTRMFQSAFEFNQDISNWNVSNVTSMDRMFENARAFEQDLSSWCVENILTKPDRFDTNSPFEGDLRSQPFWGVPCDFEGNITVIRGESIQAAIDAAQSGETIYVGPGLFKENLTINVENLTLKSVRGRDFTTIDALEATNGIRVLGNLGNVTVKGFTVRNFVQSGIVQGMAASEGTSLHIINNTVYPRDGYLRNGLQVSGNYSSVIGNLVEGAPLTADWAGSAIQVVNAHNVLVKNNTIIGSADIGVALTSWGTDTTINNITVVGNSISGANRGIMLSNNSGGITGDEFTLEGNSFTNNEIHVFDRSSKKSLDMLSIFNNNEFDKSVLISDRILSTIQAAIDAADNGDTILVGPGVYEETLSIDLSNLTIIGTSNTYINSSGLIGISGAGGVNSANWIRSNNVTIDNINFIGDNSLRGMTVTGENFTLSNSNIDSMRNSAINLFDSTGTRIINVSVKNTNGAGMVVKGLDIVLENINTSNNSWGGIAISNDGSYPRDISSVRVIGSNNISDFLYIESRDQMMTFGFNDSVNVQLQEEDFKYFVGGSPRAGLDQIYFRPNLSSAVELARLVNTVHIENMFVGKIDTNILFVEEGISIQNTINNAQDGDTIFVGEGVYEENLTINKSVSIIGIGNVTILSNTTSGNMPNSRPAIIIESENVTLNNLNIISIENSNGVNKNAILINGDNTSLLNLNVNISNQNPSFVGIRINSVNNTLIENVTISGGPIAGNLAENSTTTLIGNSIENVGDESIWFTGNNYNLIVNENNGPDGLKLTGVPASINENNTTEIIELISEIINTNNIEPVSIGSIEGIRNIQNLNTGLYFASIQAAINAAQDGDTIFVGEGVYEEDLTINKSVSIIGIGNVTILSNTTSGNMPNSRPAIIIESENVTLNNLNIISVENSNGVNKNAILINGDNASLLNLNVNISNQNPSFVGIRINSVNNTLIENVTISGGPIAGNLAENSTTTLIGNSIENVGDESIWFTGNNYNLIVNENNGPDGLKLTGVPTSINGDTSTVLLTLARQIIDNNNIIPVSVGSLIGVTEGTPVTTTPTPGPTGDGGGGGGGGFFTPTTPEEEAVEEETPTTPIGGGGGIFDITPEEETTLPADGGAGGTIEETQVVEDTFVPTIAQEETTQPQAGLGGFIAANTPTFIGGVVGLFIILAIAGFFLFGRR